jgi:hypothetical protein
LLTEKTSPAMLRDDALPQQLCVPKTSSILSADRIA